jgi:tetratricopeptide (TPR) repeat protein
MLHALLLFMALQQTLPSADNIFGGPRRGPIRIMVPGCTFHVNGELIFPAYIPVPQLVDIELQPLNVYGKWFKATSNVYNQFQFDNVPPDDYYIVIRIQPGLDAVSQQLFLLPEDCGIQKIVVLPRVLVPMHISPAIKPSPIAEDAVSIEVLKREIPSQAVKAFDKTMDGEPKAAGQKTTASLDEILKIAPDYYEANLELGLAYRKESQNHESVQALQRALEINPGSMLARAALGQFDFEANDFKNAADLLSQATRLGNTSPDVYYMLGISHYKLNQLDLAEASLLRSLAITPTIGKSHLALYNVYMQLHQPGKALKEADSYLEQYPNAQDHEYVQSMADKLRKTLTPQP